MSRSVSGRGSSSRAPVGSPPQSEVGYRESLRQPWWIWLLLVAGVGSLGVAYGAALGVAAGWWLCLLGWAGGGVAVWRSATRIQVDSEVFAVGMARLPTQYIGKVAALSEADTDMLTGPEADPRAHTFIRKTRSKRAVVVEVTDTRDPHPYWLVSTRHPDHLAAALVQVRPSSYRPVRKAEP